MGEKDSFLISLPHVMGGWSGAFVWLSVFLLLCWGDYACFLSVCVCLFICLSLSMCCWGSVSFITGEGQSDVDTFPHPSNSTLSATNPFSLSSCFPSWGFMRVTSWPSLLYSRPWNGLQVLCWMSYLSVLLKLKSAISGKLGDTFKLCKKNRRNISRKQ